jgi:hypothetical protein
MAESQILGLFASPRNVEDAVRQQIRQTAPQFESAPNQRLFNAIAEAGAAFDPRVQQARQQQEVAKSVTGEFGSSQYYYDLAEQFRQRGMLQSAIVAADKAKQIEQDLMDKATAKYGSISFVQYGSQATVIRKLITQIERTKEPAVKAELQRQLEEAFKKGAAEVADREAQEAGKAEAAKLREQRRNESLNDVKEQFEKANTNDETIFTLKNGILNNLQNINTGFGSSVITGFQQFARALGITEADSRWSVLSANTQAAQSIIGQLMLKQIKTLGTNPSNADREFLMKTLPDMSNDPEAIRKIAAFLEAKAIFLREDARAKLKHLQDDKNNDLVNYETPKEVFDKLEKFYRDAGVTASRDEIPDEELEDMPRTYGTAQPSTVAPEVLESQQAADGEAVVTPTTPAPTVEPTPQPESIIPPATPRTAEQTEVSQNVIPQGLREPAETSAGIAAQQAELQMMLQGDFSPADQSALAGQISRLGQAKRQLQEQETQTFNTAVDAIVTSAFPTSFGAEQRLANMTRKQKLEYAYRVLTLKMNSGREMSQVELKILRQIINELEAQL